MPIATTVITYFMVKLCFNFFVKISTSVTGFTYCFEVNKIQVIILEIYISLNCVNVL